MQVLVVAGVRLGGDQHDVLRPSRQADVEHPAAREPADALRGAHHRHLVEESRERVAELFAAAIQDFGYRF